MRLGILADIHEDAERLTLALRRFRQEGVQQIVVLGDVVFEMGSRLHETIALLAEAGAVGVWGNHDLGLCHEPEERIKERYAGPVFDFMRTLRPRLELEGCLFTHGLPYYDATDPVGYYLGERPETAEGLAKSFAASSHPVLFVGHFHRWLVASPGGRLALGRDRADPPAAGRALLGGGRRRVRRLVRCFRHGQPCAGALPASLVQLSPVRTV